MNVSNNGIRVIRLESSMHLSRLPVDSKHPIDIEGTVLALYPDGYASVKAFESKDWFKIFFGDISIYATIRWDNDYKSDVLLSSLAICSFGTISMCWPLFGPSKDKFAHRFDNRLAEERHPRTVSLTFREAFSSKLKGIPKYTISEPKVVSTYDIEKQKHTYTYNLDKSQGVHSYYLDEHPTYDVDKVKDLPAYNIDKMRGLSSYESYRNSGKSPTMRKVGYQTGYQASYSMSITDNTSGVYNAHQLVNYRLK